jgi:hypothetical protein
MVNSCFRRGEAPGLKFKAGFSYSLVLGLLIQEFPHLGTLYATIRRVVETPRSFEMSIVTLLFTVHTEFQFNSFKLLKRFH